MHKHYLAIAELTPIVESARAHLSRLARNSALSRAAWERASLDPKVDQGQLESQRLKWESIKSAHLRAYDRFVSLNCSLEFLKGDVE
jgi:hypothetical protein